MRDKGETLRVSYGRLRGGLNKEGEGADRRLYRGRGEIKTTTFLGRVSDKDGGDKGETGTVKRERGRWGSRGAVGEEPLRVLCNSTGKGTRVTGREKGKRKKE